MDMPLVSRWMSSPAITIAEDCSLLEAYHAMQQHRIRRLPVTAQGKLVGILTIGDIRSYAPLGSMPLLESSNTLSATVVRQGMSQAVITVSSASSLAAAAQLMLENKVGGLPVLAGEELVGVISESDLFRYLLQVDVQTAAFTAPIESHGT